MPAPRPYTSEWEILGCAWMHRGGAICVSSVLSCCRCCIRSPCRFCDELSDHERHHLQSISRRSGTFRAETNAFNSAGALAVGLKKRKHCLRRSSLRLDEVGRGRRDQSVGDIPLLGAQTNPQFLLSRCCRPHLLPKRRTGYRIALTLTNCVFFV